MSLLRKLLTPVHVLACLALLLFAAAVLVPELWRDVERGRIKRTMSDLRSLGTALGSYQVDYDGYPPAAGGQERLFRALAPYIVDPARVDAWGRPFRYETTPAQDGLSSSYTLTSVGADGQGTGWIRDTTRYFDCDIIYNDGQFLQSPEGLKKSGDQRILRILDIDSRRKDAPQSDPVWAALATGRVDDATIDGDARALMASKAGIDGAALDRMVAAFERNLARDTVRNDLLLGPEAHRWFAVGAAPRTPRELDARVYAELFLAPTSDPWIGLVPRRLEETPHRWARMGSAEETRHGENRSLLVPASNRGLEPSVLPQLGGGAMSMRRLAFLAASPDDGVVRRAVAALRDLGPAGLDGYLAAHRARIDAAGARAASARSAEERRLLAALDAIARQKDDHASRLYWYTDLDAALESARASGKPVLSLRMLGNLDEELSCANSRYFRTALYPDAAVGRELREHFVLHWHSVRPVPKVTIDFGDGRVLHQTIAGNSAHYLLDVDGRPVEVLPGMNGPGAFLRWLREAAELAARTAGLTEAEKDAVLAAHHGRQLAELEARAAPDLRRLFIESPPRVARALDGPLYAGAGIEIDDPYLGSLPADTYTGLDEDVVRPRPPAM